MNSWLRCSVEVSGSESMWQYCFSNELQTLRMKLCFCLRLVMPAA
jgi:hypothetical protein